MELSLAFIVFVLVSAFTPGPNNIMIMASGLNYGVARSLPAFDGDHARCTVDVSRRGFGVSLAVADPAMVKTNRAVVGNFILALFGLVGSFSRFKPVTV